MDHIGLCGWTAAQMRASLRAADGAPCTDVTDRAWLSLPAALQRAARAGRPYTHVALLAGTNDLCQLAPLGERTPAAALADLAALHDAAHEAGVPCTLALSVPQPAFERAYAHVAQGRAALAQGLRALGGRARFVDAAAALPHLSAPDAEREARWEPDGLHLTPAGYDQLADAVFAALRADAGVTAPGADVAAVAPAGAALLARPDR